MAIGDITKTFIREWAADLSGSMSAASVHKIFTVVRQVLAMAVEEQRLVSNPAEHVELPAVTELEQRFLTLDQLHALAAAAGEHRALVYVLGTCGLRFGEVAELRWKDVDLDKLTIRVARSIALVNGKFEEGAPKSGKARTVSLPAFVGDLLVAGEKERLVFPDTQGGPMRGTNVRRRWWAQAVEAADIHPRTDGDKIAYDFKLHELRHTAASLAIQAGANIKALQNMLGHESAGLTLDRYGHLYPSDVDAVGVAINVLLTRSCVQDVSTEPVSA
jgi:integrase